MEGNPPGQVRPLILWLLLTPGPAIAWLLAWAAAAVLTFSNALWDPDEVEMYLARSPWAHLLDALVGGLLIGVVAAVLIGVLFIATRRHVREAVAPVVAVIIGSTVLCALMQVGPSVLQRGSLWPPLRLGAAAGIIGGLVCGLWQQALLHRRCPQLTGWLLWTVICWTAGWSLLWPVAGGPEADVAAYPQVPAFVAAGVVAAVGPWWKLHTVVPGATWFILASAFGWGIVGTSWVWLHTPYAGGIVMGSLVSAALVMLLKDAPQPNATPANP
jgi:hypothetical protein